MRPSSATRAARTSTDDHPGITVAVVSRETSRLPAPSAPACTRSPPPGDCFTWNIRRAFMLPQRAPSRADDVGSCARNYRRQVGTRRGTRGVTRRREPGGRAMARVRKRDPMPPLHTRPTGRRRPIRPESSASAKRGPTRPASCPARHGPAAPPPGDAVKPAHVPATASAPPHRRRRRRVLARGRPSPRIIERPVRRAGAPARRP